jgi:guanylate kinase
MRGILFIITSPSGGGKGTLIREVLRTVPNIGYSVSFTTRGVRVGEEHGKHYFFVSTAEFEKLIEKGEFLEFANVHGNFYGTSKTEVERETSAGRDIILEIDVQGAEIIKNQIPNAISIFILPPSFEVLKERLTLRQTESEEALAIRLNNAAIEVARFQEFDYVIINDKIDNATRDLQAVIYAERLKTERQAAAVTEILDTF